MLACACCGWCPEATTGWCAALGRSQGEGRGWLRGTVLSAAMRRNERDEIATLSDQTSGFIVRPEAARVQCALAVPDGRKPGALLASHLLTSYPGCTAS